jgi:Asp-tRNA(Asn)/Glu-tRNA(Gln) amidotransferase A subunit family amidase
MVPLAFGSQTAGSLIRPASYCGVFALKPTHGRFSLAGVKPFAPSLDTLGWLARSADDLELMRCALAAQPFVPLQRRPAGSLRLGVCRTHEWPALDAGGVQAWHSGLDRLARAQVRLQALEMPADLAGLLEAQKAIMAWEASRCLAPEFRAHREQLSQPLVDLVQLGMDMPAARHDEAQALAAAGRRQVALLMKDVDALLVPAAPGEAPQGLAATGDPVFSRVWTLLGLPCVNVPGLLGPNGMPVGLQLVGAADRERELLEVAACVHAALG